MSELNIYPSQALVESKIRSIGNAAMLYPWNKIHSSTPAVVLKLEHYGSLGIIRSLGRLGIPVYGVDRKKFIPAEVSKYCKGIFNIDIENSNEKAAVNALIKIFEQLGTVSILIPTSDETFLFLIKHAKELRKYFLFPSISYELAQTLCSKKEMYFLALENNVAAPESFFPESLYDVIEFARRKTFPLILKGINGGRLEVRTGRKMIIVNNKSQLINFYNQMEDNEENNLMLQEYIPNTKHHMWIFNGYFDSSSNCLAAFTGRKLRQNPVYTGMTSLGICQWNDALVKIAKKFLSKIHYTGPVDIDYIFDLRDNKYKILDVNPRIGASFRLFTGENGIDVARALYLDETYQSVPFTKSLEGRKWFVEDKDLLSSFRYGKEGSLSMQSWIKSFNGVQEAGYFAKDDFKPFVLMLINHIVRSSLKFLKRVKSSLHGKINFPDYSNMNTKPDITYRLTGSTDSSNEEHEQMQRVKRYYDKNKNWLGEVYETSSDPHAKGVRRRKEYILKMLDKSHGLIKGRALDIGCGPGAYMHELEMRGCKVYGVDLSTEMLKRCMNNLINTKYAESFSSKDSSMIDFSKSAGAFVNLACADATSLPFPDAAFNLVLSVGVLQYVLSAENAVKELNRLTSKGGLIIVCVENSIAVSNIGYTFIYKIKSLFRKKSGAGNRASGKEIISRWFLSHVSVPHLYKLYNPYSLEKLLMKNGLKKRSAVTYGYPFKILRRLKFIPQQQIEFLEKKIEMVLHKIKIPVLSYLGEFYIGIFQKISDKENDPDKKTFISGPELSQSIYNYSGMELPEEK